MNTAWDWADLAFGSKKPLKQLDAVFIAAPREISAKRFRELLKTYLPAGNIVLGIAKEPYVDGFEGQAQFKTLRLATVQKTIEQVNTAGRGRSITVLQYFQRELPYILEKVPFKRAVLVRGSWQHVFHSSKAFYTLAAQRTPYELVSPFVDETEAREYEARIAAEWGDQFDQPVGKLLSETDMMTIANQIAKQSFDYGFQTGAAVGRQTRPGSDRYRFVVGGFNRVVPYQTYALLHGASREDNFSPANDLNHYDTIHGEVDTMLRAQRQHLDLSGTTLFINLMPCPSCARMLSQTDIAEFVYSIDHSDGYAVKMLELAGKKVRRLVL